MNLSEEDFGALSRDERTRIKKEVDELPFTLKELGRHSLSVGENAQASGDKQTAKAHYEAVLHLGQTMSSPEHYAVMQQVGKAVVMMAEKRLSALK